MSNFNYNPDAFRPATLSQARELVLPAGESSTDFRWEKETPVLAEMILRELEVRHGDLMLDYGCGIGRLAKEMCVRGAKVIGVDSSPEMRRMASEYVNSPGKFLAVSPEELQLLRAHGLRVDSVFAVWVLQHCIAPSQDMDLIFNCLKPQGKLFVVNNRTERVVPVKEAPYWVGDGADIWQMLDQYFGLQRTIPFPYGAGSKPEAVACRAYLKTFSRA